MRWCQVPCSLRSWTQRGDEVHPVSTSPPPFIMMPPLQFLIINSAFMKFRLYWVVENCNFLFQKRMTKWLQNVDEININVKNKFIKNNFIINLSNNFEVFEKINFSPFLFSFFFIIKFLFSFFCENRHFEGTFFTFFFFEKIVYSRDNFPLLDFFFNSDLFEILTFLFWFWFFIFFNFILFYFLWKFLTFFPHKIVYLKDNFLYFTIILFYFLTKSSIQKKISYFF